MTTAVIVYESVFGNSREVARAVERGIAHAVPGATVRCLPVREATPALVGDADLLVVGGPTHVRVMTTRVSRGLGLKDAERRERTPYQLEAAAKDIGLRDWFRDLPATAGTPAAAFDTHVGSAAAGGAAKGIAQRLEHHGYAMSAAPEGFLVDDAPGPLSDGELERAEGWGARLGHELLVPSA